MTAVPGRLEQVPNRLGVSVFVDYAQTDDAMANVLDRTTLADLIRQVDSARARSPREPLMYYI